MRGARWAWRVGMRVYMRENIYGPIDAHRPGILFMLRRNNNLPIVSLDGSNKRQAFWRCARGSNNDIIHEGVVAVRFNSR